MNAPFYLVCFVVLLCIGTWFQSRRFACRAFNPIERGYWLKSFQAISVPKMTTPNGLECPAEHLHFMREKARKFQISEAEIGMTFKELLGHAVMRQREVMEGHVAAGNPSAQARQAYEKLNAEWLLANGINPASCQRLDVPNRLTTSS